MTVLLCLVLAALVASFVVFALYVLFGMSAELGEQRERVAVLRERIEQLERAARLEALRVIDV